MSTETEEWRPIDRHEGYEVSDHGRVRSIDRIVMRIKGSTLYPMRRRGGVIRPVSDGNGYVSVALDKGKRYRIHVLVARAFLGFDEGKIVDHENSNRSDNRPGNLRLATRSQNCYHQGRRSNNTSGIKGAYRLRDRWVVRIKFNGKRLFLGSFIEKEEAARAYDAKAVELFGDFALTNAAMGLIKTA